MTTPATLERALVEAAVSEPIPPPDLLHPARRRRGDLRPVRDTLTIAFASGAPPAALDQHRIAAMPLESSWTPGHFAEQVFLPELVTRCLRFKVNGREVVPNAALLGRVLANPPSEPSVVAYRQAILGELSRRADLRADLERLYGSVLELRCQLETCTASRWDEGTRRKLAILTAAKGAFDAMAGGFVDATSGLAELREFGKQLQSTEAYRRLHDLLAFDNELATFDLRVRIGADGRIRDLDALAIRENTPNRFHRTPLGRALVKLMMLLRGFRSSEDELVARHIINVFDGIDEDLIALLAMQDGMEFHLSALALRDRAARDGLEVSLPEFTSVDDGSGRELIGLFNPLLLGLCAHVVACDVVMDHFDTTVIVTGPNSGGKTRLLEAIALTQMMGQAGFFVPARRARLCPVRGLFVSLIEQQKADQTEGRLGTELVRIRELFESMQVGDMVVLDELCTGTNPSEGEEIFRLVISLLSELGPQAFISTHFLLLATRLEADRPVEHLVFLQVDLDEHQWPTYRFVPGVATTSLAHMTASRLGVTREELVALVERCKAAERTRRETAKRVVPGEQKG